MNHLRPLALLPLLASPLLAAVPADFATTRPLLPPAPLSAPRLAEVRLDAPLFASTQPDHSDLRLFNAAGTELPRLVEPLFTTRQRLARHPVPAHPTTLRELPDNRIEARFELEPDSPPPSGLSIRTPLKDFIRSVRVYGSQDGLTWDPLVPDTDLFDYSRHMDIRRTEIPLPPNNPCRHFSIEISNATEERAQPLIRLVQARGGDSSRATDLLQTPFRIDGVTFWRETPVLDRDLPVTQDWPHSGLEIAQDPKTKTTLLTLQTGSAPLSSLEILTPDRNFQRSASVQIPSLRNGRLTWLTIAEDTLTRLDLPGLATNDCSIDFPPQRAPQIRLVLHNHDNPPLAISDVRPSGPIHRLLWLAEPSTDYLLAAGNDPLPPPSYDLYPIRAALSQSLPPDLWSLGPPSPPRRPPSSFALGEFLSRPPIFGTLLAAAALLLLLLLAQALKKSPP